MLRSSAFLSWRAGVWAGGRVCGRGTHLCLALGVALGGLGGVDGEGGEVLGLGEAEEVAGHAGEGDDGRGGLGLGLALVGVGLGLGLCGVGGGGGGGGGGHAGVGSRRRAGAGRACARRVEGGLVGSGRATVYVRGRILVVL